MDNNISIKKAALYNAASKYSVVVLNIISGAVLARILSPDDYGVVAVVTIFTTLFSTLSDMGFGVAIVQRQDLDDDSVRSIFSFTLIIALVLMIIFCFLGLPIAVFYNNNAYISICAILSISVFCNTANMIPNAILRKNKMFLQLAVRTVSINFLGFLFALVFALNGWKYYALVFQSVFSAVLTLAWNLLSTRIRPVIKIKFKAVRSVMSYSMYQFAFNIVNYLETNLDNILISGFMGSTSLAYYNKAYKITSYPVSNIGGVVSPVLHPILSQYQQDSSIIYKKYLELQKAISLIGVYIVEICILCGGEMILILYGNQWENSVLPFQFLSVAIYPMLMMTTTGAVFQSLGNTKALFYAGILNSIINAICIFIGVITAGYVGVAGMVGVSNWILMVVSFSILMKFGFKLPIFGYFKEFIGDIIFLVTTTVLTVCLFNFWKISSVFVNLIVKIVTVTVLFLLYIVIFGKIKYLKRIIIRK